LDSKSAAEWAAQYAIMLRRSW